MKGDEGKGKGITRQMGGWLFNCSIHNAGYALKICHKINWNYSANWFNLGNRKATI